MNSFVYVWYDKHMQDIYVTFEFNKIQSAIKEYSKTEIARDNIDQLKMFSSSKEVNE